MQKVKKLIFLKNIFNTFLIAKKSKKIVKILLFNQKKFSNKNQKFYQTQK